MPQQPTIRNVAAHAGVSIGTISNYLNGTKTVSPATGARIDAAIESTGFVFNRAVRTLRGNRTRTLGLLVPDAGNPHFTEIARGVEDVARSRGYVLVYCDTAGESDREAAYLLNLAEMRAGGVILSSTQVQLPDLSSLQRLGTPIVILGDENTPRITSTVVTDARRSGDLAMGHLLSLGHRDVLFAGGPGGNEVLDARFAGAHDALERAGLPHSVLRRVDAVGRTVIERSALGELVIAMSPRPTAVLAGNDLVAIAMMNRLIRAGWRMPGDLSIVGFDDINDAQLAAVPLTTVRQPAYAIGQAAARLLFHQIDEPGDQPRSTAFAAELVVRESTAAPRTSVA